MCLHTTTCFFFSFPFPTFANSQNSHFFNDFSNIHKKRRARVTATKENGFGAGRFVEQAMHDARLVLRWVLLWIAYPVCILEAIFSCFFFKKSRHLPVMICICLSTHPFFHTFLYRCLFYTVFCHSFPSLCFLCIVLLSFVVCFFI